MLLAASGWRVTVVESQQNVGGRTSRVQLGPYAFDRGPTFFLMPYVLEEIFRATGRRLADAVDLQRLDPMYRLIIGKPGSPEGTPPTTIDTTQDIEEMARRLSRVHPRDGEMFPSFIADTRAKLRLMEPILRAPIRSPLDLMSVGSMKFLPHLHPHLSVAGLLKKYFQTHESRLAVSFQSKYLGMSPNECPSLFTILPFIEYEYGIWHPTGGCNALIHAMADACRQMGVDIRCASPVRAIDFDGRRVSGLRFDHRSERFDNVVLNADATWALKNLVPERLRPRHSDRWIDSRRYSCSTFMLYLGVEGAVDHLPHHSIYISREYEQNLADITGDGTDGRNGRMSNDPSVYVCNPSVTDATMAPSGHSALYVLMPCPSGRASLDWTPGTPAYKEARRRVLLQLEHRFGIRNIESRIRAEQVYTPADWQSLGISFGATFNMAHNLGQMLHKRVPHKYPGIDGLWFVGGGTHPGSGLPVIFLSSQITAKLMCDAAGVTSALKNPLHAPLELTGLGSVQIA
jgi:phytoene desaturase